jgi:large subunit ribosomal protein L15
MPAGFEGGQMPLAMRLGKLRGSTSKDAMPVGPHRTQTQPVNVRDLERFKTGGEVTPELLVEQGLVRTASIDIKILGGGELTKKLTVVAHRFSASAREKIEKAGGSVVSLREPPVEKAKRRRSKAKKVTEPEPADETVVEPEPEAEAEHEEEPEA